MARTPIMAAGGIVLRREQPPRIAVVRLRKRDEWVLPKGKLDDGETPREAAKREVLEETGHKVTVHEFLGTLVHDTGTRSKVVHYWRMEATGTQTQPLMDDVRAVDWLPLDAAVDRLSRDHEKTFLETVGPYALAGLIRKVKAKPAQEPKAGVDKAAVEKAVVEKPVTEKVAVEKVPVEKPSTEKPAMAKKRRSRAAPEPSELSSVPAAVEPSEAIPQAVEIREAIPEIASEPALDASPALDCSGPVAAEAASAPQTEPVAAPDAAAAERVPADLERVEAVAAAIKSLVPSAAEAVTQAAHQGEDAPKPEAELQDSATAGADASDGRGRRSLAQKMRAWLGRAA